MGASGSGRRLRVLVADDSATLRALFRAALEQAHADVDTAGDGAEAIARVEAADDEGRPYNLVLMDVVMPEVNGCNAAWELRRRGYGGKIVLITAADDRYDLAASLSAGADDFLAKPFTPPDLHRLLETHCLAPA